MKNKIEMIDDHITFNDLMNYIRPINEAIRELNKRMSEIENRIKSNEDYLAGFEKALLIALGGNKNV